jgi:hypothetical protein
MSRLRLTIALVGLLGCVPAQTPLAPPDHVSVASAADTLFGCAMRTVNELSYTVEGADRAAGFLRARRETSGFMGMLFRVREYDVLTVTIYPGDSGRTTLRVVAQGAMVSSGEPDASTYVASDKGMQHVQTILRVCGTQFGAAATSDTVGYR